MADHDNQAGSRRSLIDLIRSIPDLVGRLLREEIRSAREEVLSKTKALGTGVVLVLAAIVVILFGLGFLLQGAAHGLELVLPAWAASLLVGGASVLFAAVLAVAGLKLLRRGAPPVPSATLDNVREDVHAVRGS